ncbi:unnamed protein product [Allacma fusca]|uniref:Uncharacterized protein n=1 Tax=Allacma fusca TaxID=39272 RepID=A0A8J2L3T4_9HEXA|nr:unnamed protein product [Allacma fusca]
MTTQVILSFALLFLTTLINCAPLSDEANREGRQWNHGYDYSIYRPFPSPFAAFQARIRPTYFGNRVFSSFPNSGNADSRAYGMTYSYGSPGRYSGSIVSNRWSGTGAQSGSHSSVSTGSFSSANGINSYGTAGTRLSTEFGTFPGLLIGNGQLFNPGFGSSISGIGFSGSQFASGGGFVGIQSRVSGGGFSGLVHSGSVSNSGYSDFPEQPNVISNTQTTATKNGNPVNSANSVANMENSGIQGATTTNVKAASKTMSEGKGYSTSSTHSEAQGYSDGDTGTVNANVDTQSTSKGTASSESIGDADALAKGTTIGGKIRTNSNVTTDSKHEMNVSQDGREIVRSSSVESHAGGEKMRPASYTHVYNSGPIPDAAEKVAQPEPNPAQNVPSSISIPITQVAQPAPALANAAEPNVASINAVERDVAVANNNQQNIPDMKTGPTNAETPSGDSENIVKPTNLQSEKDNISESQKLGGQTVTNAGPQNQALINAVPTLSASDIRAVEDPPSGDANPDGNEDSAQGNDLSDDYLIKVKQQPKLKNLEAQRLT